MSLDLRGRPFEPAGPRPRTYTDSTWGFRLERLAGDRTRLVVSGYWELRPRWLRPVLSIAVLEPSHWIMQTRQFTNLERRVASSASGPAGTRPSELCAGAMAQ
jgi:hypothetical protein